MADWLELLQQGKDSDNSSIRDTMQVLHHRNWGHPAAWTMAREAKAARASPDFAHRFRSRIGLT